MKMKIGSECCNNCIHWECGSQRSIVGSPPEAIEVLFDSYMCSVSRNRTEWRNRCGMFRHVGGVRNTFRPDPSSDSMLTIGESFIKSVYDYAAARKARTVSTVSREAKPKLETCPTCGGTGESCCSQCFGTGKQE